MPSLPSVGLLPFEPEHGLGLTLIKAHLAATTSGWELLLNVKPMSHHTLRIDIFICIDLQMYTHKCLKGAQSSLEFKIQCWYHHLYHGLLQNLLNEPHATVPVPLQSIPNFWNISHIISFLSSKLSIVSSFTWSKSPRPYNSLYNPTWPGFMHLLWLIS